MGRTIGMYPGGPQPLEAVARQQIRANARLTSVAEYEGFRLSVLNQVSVVRRRFRLVIGAMLAIGAALLTGVLLGQGQEQSTEALVPVAEADPISQESEKILRELWKMEALERSARSSVGSVSQP